MKREAATQSFALDNRKVYIPLQNQSKCLFSRLKRHVYQPIPTPSEEGWAILCNNCNNVFILYFGSCNLKQEWLNFQWRIHWKQIARKSWVKCKRYNKIWRSRISGNQKESRKFCSYQVSNWTFNQSIMLRKFKF